MTGRSIGLATALVAAAFLSACSSNARPSLSPLEAGVSALTTAAAADNLPAARAALIALQSELNAEHATGTVTQARYDQITVNIRAVSRDLIVTASTPAPNSLPTHTSTPTPNTVPRRAQSPRPTDHGEMKNHGSGKNNGSGNGNGGDD